MSSPDDADLNSRIRSWTEEVALADEHQQARPSTKTAAQAHSYARAPLIPISANASKGKRGVTAALSKEPEPEPRKRPRTSSPPTSNNLSKPKQDLTSGGKKESSAQKRPQVRRRRRIMADNSMNKITRLRRSGRERKPTDKAQQDQERLASPQDDPANPPSFQTAPRLIPSSSAALSNADEIERPLPSPSKSTGSPTKRTGSPKKRDRTLGRPKTDASLNITDLARLVPAVHFMEVGDVLESIRPLPESVALLRQRLFDKPGYIPYTLKPHYDKIFSTPTKSKGVLHGDPYQDTFANGTEDAICLKKEVEYISRTAAWNHTKAAHERQWGTATISPILNAIAMIHADKVQLLNLESCSIQPIELRPERHGGGRIDVEAESMASTDTTRTNPSLTASRMVDYGFGLRLPLSGGFVINDAFSCLEDSKRSLNQSLAYHDSVPLLTDIEIKETHSERAPGVQLGVWQAAGYEKRKLHGWSTSSVSMPGICISGHDWVAYITFESAEHRLIAMGPIRIGDTRSIFGIWQILYKLDQLLQWGETEYRNWFEEEVMTWARDTAARR